jgi:diguanylate cyclase (GGDEF)-like protein/PAS domain S-box-containing protein
MAAREHEEEADPPRVPVPDPRSRARFDQSATPQALLDTEGRLVEVNDAGCELLGRSHEDLRGRYATEVVHPSDPHRVRETLTRLRQGGLRSASYETVGLRPDGTRVPLQIDVTAVHDERGHPYEFAALARDLTDLREVQRRLQSQEAFFRALNQAASDFTLVVGADGDLLYVTPSIERALGYQPEGLDDVFGKELAHPDDLQRVVEHWQRLRTPGARDRFDVRVRRADGEWHWFQVTVTNCLDDTHINGMVVNLRDIAVEKAAVQALRESEARYRAIAEAAQEGILAVSPQDEILFVNERLTEVLGISLDRVDELSRQGEFWKDGGPERFDVDYRHPDGRSRVLSVSSTGLCTEDGHVLGSLAMVSDVTEQRSAEARLHHQATHDALTGLPNRALFADRLATAGARQERTGGRGVAVLFVDLDDFKQVNDTHGHQAGDRVLTAVAGRLAESVRATDTVARLGGDEFAAICEDSDAVVALQVAGRVQAALETPVEVDAELFAVRASVGIALSPPHPVTDLLRLADRAMYTAKADPARSVLLYEDEDGDRG